MDNYETGIYTDNPDDTLRYMRSTQAIEVVRCKDCERWIRYEDDVFGNCTFNHGVTDKYFFCADGERR